MNGDIEHTMEYDRRGCGPLHVTVGLQTGSTVKFHVSHCRKIPTLSPSRQSVILKALKIINYKIDGGAVMGYNVAIDGPAGAGKSTIAKLVAKEKGYVYVDTGAMYRGLAIHFLENGIEAEETGKIVEACKDADVTIRYEDGQQQVYLNGKNITAKLREEVVGNMASKSSAIPEVRAKLLELQRELARREDVIMDGRDIGTCVLPDADVKVFLTASVETRAKRRYDELVEKGVPCNLEEIARDIAERDERDSTREIAPLKQAEDAVLVDSSHMTIEEVVAAIVKLCD